MRYSKNEDLNQKAKAFVKKYSCLKETHLDIDEYNRVYLKKYLEKLEYNTYLACSLLQGLDSSSFNSIVDLGGGIGFNTAFFSFLGFENVLYFDVDKISTRDAKIINNALGLSTIEYYATGFEDLTKIDLSQSLVCSRDVVEHIYDLPRFFEITKPAKLNRHNTAAIQNSFFRKKEFETIHDNAENLGDTSKIKKQRDTALPYLEVRQEIIANYLPQKSKEEIQKLAKETRGLNQKDIENYLFSDRLPLYHARVLHTNTCDPITGNWAERTMFLADYKLLAGSIPLKFKLVKYNEFNGSGIKKRALKLLNFLLRITKKVRLAPSFTIEY